MIVVCRNSGQDFGAPPPPLQQVERQADSTLQSGDKGDRLESGQMPTRGGL